MTNGSPADGTTTGAELNVTGLEKIFTTGGREVRAVDGVSYTVRPGEFFTLLGPSGCGKTTSLRIVAGLEHLTGGTVAIDGRTLSSPTLRVPPEKRELGMVFQQYAVWPHMSVFKNLAFPMQISPTRYTRAQISDRVEEMLDIVQLSEAIHRPATQLSGGQQQRLALARALVCRPKLLLLDEPLSNLDARLRDRMRMELKRIQKQAGVTAIYVTHDQAEALSMSDRVAVMHRGVVAQEGTPREIYESPANPFVAKFVGNTTLLDAEVLALAEEGRQATVRTSLGVLTASNDGHELAVGDRMQVSIRPENITLSAAQPGDEGLIGTVRQLVYLGDMLHGVVEAGQGSLTVRVHPWDAVVLDGTVRIDIPARACVIVAG
ncbi:MAG: ABC transporter ATP-binding protein [Microbacterium sp.]